MAAPGNAPWSIVGGATNFTRHEIQAWARRLLTSETYRAQVEADLLAKTLPLAHVIMLHHYAFGKPIEQVNLTVQQAQEDLSQLSIKELIQRQAEIAKELQEAEELEAAIDLNPPPGNVAKGPWQP